MDAETVVSAGSGFPWEALLVVIILAAAWYAGRSINTMKRPVCNGGCAGCHGARRGRGCAFPDRRSGRTSR